jgi:hypothetical protein
VVVRVTNAGNIAANGSVTIKLYASSDGALDATDPILVTIPAKSIHLKPGKSKTFRVRFTALSDPGGAYNLIAATTPTLPSADQDASNDVAVIATI